MSATEEWRVRWMYRDKDGDERTRECGYFSEMSARADAERVGRELGAKYVVEHRTIRISPWKRAPSRSSGPAAASGLPGKERTE